MKYLLFPLLLAIAFATAQEGEVLDISKLVESVNPTDSIVPEQVAPESVASVPVAPTVMDSNPSKRPSLIKWERTGSSGHKGTPKLTLFLGGGVGSPWFDLGVIDAIEKYGIPIANVVGAGWGAWIGAAWAEGYSSAQIRSWLMEADSISPHLWSSTPTQDSSRFTSLSKAISQTGTPSLELTIAKPRSSQSGNAILAELLLQQPLLALALDPNLKADRVPWSVLLCDEKSATVVRSPDRPAMDWVLTSMGLQKSQEKGASLLPLEKCGIASPQELETLMPEQFWLLSFAWPERTSGDEPLYLQRAINQLSSDTTLSKIWIRPHLVPSDSAMNRSFWIRQGFEAFRARLGNLRSLNLSPRSWAGRGRLGGGLSYVQPAFDEVPAEFQNHLSSFWTKHLEWQPGVVAFTNGVNESELYDSLSLGLVTQRTTDLEDGRDFSIPVLAVRASPRPHFTMRVGGAGTNLVGPHAYAGLNLRFVQQLEYEFSLQGRYGNWQKGFSPSALFSRIHGGEIAFYGDGLFLEQKNQNLYSALSMYVPDPYSWIEKESRQDVNLQVRWTPEPDWILRTGVSLGQSDITTLTTRALKATKRRQETYVQASSVDVYTEWESLPRQESDFFAESGHHALGRFGFRSVTIRALGQSDAPLFGRGQIWAHQTLPVGSNVVGAAYGGAGLDGRFRDDLSWRYPDSMVVFTNYPADAAIFQRYQMKIQPTPFAAYLPIPQFSSSHYAQLGASLGFHQNGNGFWIFGAWVHDFMGTDPWNNIEQTRISVEPVFRLHFQSVDLLAGVHRTVNSQELDQIWESKDLLWVVQVGLSAF